MKTEPRITKLSAYLAGAIEHAPDGGKAWRQELGAFILNDLHHNVFDPTVNEYELLTPEERASIRAWKQTNFPRYVATVRKIITNDLNMLEFQTDYIVCLWDEYAARGGGTHGELTYAFRLGIPVYLFTPLPLDHISGWVLSCAEVIVPSLTAMKAFLKTRYQPTTTP